MGTDYLHCCRKAAVTETATLEKAFSPPIFTGNDVG
jgi:hypothetical protein